MLNSHWLLVPLALQMSLVGVDECFFHRKRGLPRWERLGHPLDTLTVFVCLSWILYVPPRPRTVALFAAMAAVSMFFVTKDEAVHRRHCCAAEHWLHACLFTLHPLGLTGAGFLWPAAHGMPGAIAWVSAGSHSRDLLSLACGGTLLFAAYQFTYWNLLWRGAPNG